ncbi:MAG: chorismate synthase, partial [Bacteroidetes bacterium]
MKANSLGRYFGISTFGESHGPAIGVLIEDIKPGIKFPLEDIQKELDKRRPGKNQFSSSRKEEDKLVVLSGVFEGKTTGMPICMIVYNKDAHSEDYHYLKDIFRPGHADYSYFKKFKIYDYRGSGRASGRETIARVAASGLVNNLLKNIEIKIFPIQIGKFIIHNLNFDFKNDLSWYDESNYTDLLTYLSKIEKNGDSIGGIIEGRISNLPAGLGDPVFEKLDANLAKAILSIGSVKGIEFGDGFTLGKLSGRKANDLINKNGFQSNHSGGILGGISTGQELIFRFVVKPTPSINIPQLTISKENEEIIFRSKGRFDTCIVLRILPVAKAMIKLVLADAIQHQKLLANEKANLNDLREAIDKIDEDILIALSRRNEISQIIGLLKEKQKFEINDKTREKKILECLISKAKEWGINTDVINKIW